MPNGLGQIGVVPNNTTVQGILKNGEVEGITNSSWNPRTGGQSTSTFKGSQAQITALAVDCQAIGFEYKIMGGHVWTLEVTFPTDILVNDINNEPDPIPIWELEYQPITIGLYDVKDRPFLSSLNGQIRRAIEDKLKDNNDSSLENLFSATSDPSLLSQKLNAWTAYKLRLNQVEGKRYFVPVLKRTAVVSNTYNGSTFASSFNPTSNLQLFTTPELTSNLNASTSNPLGAIPPVIQNLLPSSMLLTDSTSNSAQTIQAINQSGYGLDSNQLVTFVGWLQFPPTCRSLTLNKVQFQQEWLFFRWSAGQWGLYDPQNAGNVSPTPDANLIVIA
jgi:hypothetical protein